MPTYSKKQLKSRKSVPDTIMEKGIRPDSLKFVDPKTLSANPRNWRTHPKRQRRAYNSLKSQVKWAGACLYNETTQRLLDGHMRVDEAIKNGDDAVPVLMGTWTEEEEKLILASLDPIAAMAQTDEVSLQNLTAEVDKFLSGVQDTDQETLASLQKMTADIENYAKQVEAGDLPSVALPASKAAVKPRSSTKETTEEPDNDSSFQGEDEIQEVVLKDDVLFSSSNKWGIPDLSEDMLAKVDDCLPTVVYDRNQDLLTKEDVWYCYGSKPFPTTEDGTSLIKGGTLGFHTEDYRFEHCYEFPTEFVEELREHPWSLVCEPEYSVYGDWPFAMRLWNIYRSRWCARYWQEAGFTIIPALRWCFRDSDAAWLYGTLPLNGSCEVVSLAFGCGNKPSSQDLEDLERTVQLSYRLIRYRRLIIYGDMAASKYYLPVIQRVMSDVGNTDDFSVISLPSFMEARRNYFKDKPRKKRHR